MHPNEPSAAASASVTAASGAAAPLLPETLRRQFAQLERKLWKTETTLALGAALAAVCVSWALVFVSDRFWDTPGWLRAVFAALGLAALLGAAAFYADHWLWRRRDLNALAGVVRRRHPRVGDRLLGIVELADESRRPPNVSPALCRAAIAQVAAEAARLDLPASVKTRPARRAAWAGGALLALAAGAFALAPQAGWNALARWLRPTADVARYTFVSLEDLPSRLVVAHGEPFEIEVGVRPGSRWRPERASARFDRQAVIDAPIRGGHARFRLPGQTEPGTLRLQIGDASRALAIEPVLRPELKELVARVELPSYLHAPPLEEKVAAGSLTILDGSRVRLEGKIVRPLAEATLELPGGKLTKLATDGEHFRSDFLSVENVPQATLRWKDHYGLAAPAPWVLKIQHRQDAPPEVEIRGVAGSAVAMLEEETLNLTIEARDDFNVRGLEAVWQVEEPNAVASVLVHDPAKNAPPPAPPAPPLQVAKLFAGEAAAPPAKTISREFAFCPLAMRIPAERTVTLLGRARDDFPNRPAAESAPLQIIILSHEAHARLIQEQFERMLARLEDLTRRQEALLDASHQTRQAAPEKLADEESARKLGEQSAEQKNTAAQLDQLAKDGADTLREALRNPDLGSETLQKWAQQLQAMQALAQTPMPKAAQQLASAQSAQGAPQRGEQLDSAIKQEEAILQAMRDMQSGGAKTLDSLTAQNFALRLRRIAGAQKQTGETLRALLPQIVGLTTADLPAGPRGKIGELAAAQSTRGAESAQIQEEIARFFERTKLERYGDVAHEMDEAKTADALAALAKDIEANVTAQAAGRSADWSEKFTQWADRLSSGDDTKSASGEGGGDPDERALQALLALGRLRQREGALRDQTRALDAAKPKPPAAPAPEATTPTPEEEARRGSVLAAAQTQRELRDEVRALQRQPDFAVPAPALEPVRRAMGDAEALLQEVDTGRDTVNAETDAVNSLDELMSQLASGKGVGAGKLAALMRAMGLGAGTGRTPGGSMAGGEAGDLTAPRETGSRAGEAPEQRGVEQAGGRDTPAVPAEFRDAVESYQRALESAGRP